MNLENTKVYTTDKEVIRKYAALCGLPVENLDLPQYDKPVIGVSNHHKDVVVYFAKESDTDTRKRRVITPDQINALYAEKFGDVIAIETPEEAEAFNHMHKSHECEAAHPEWKNGDECVYTGQPDIKCKFVAMHPNNASCAIIWEGGDINLSCVAIDCLRKPETEAERKERECDEIAKQIMIDLCGDDVFKDRDWDYHKKFTHSARIAFKLVKAGYRKQKDGE